MQVPISLNHKLVDKNEGDGACFVRKRVASSIYTPVLSSIFSTSSYSMLSLPYSFLNHASKLLPTLPLACFLALHVPLLLHLFLHLIFISLSPLATLSLHACGNSEMVLCPLLLFLEG